jgi:hypothetical protein
LVRQKALSAEVEALRYSRRGADVSALALEIHVQAVGRGIGSSCPSFIPDQRLDAITSGSVTTMAAIELWLSGLWFRVEGGYVADDPELIDHLSVGRLRRWARKLWRYLNSEPVIPF